jgi:hypothetical protein
MLIFFAVQIVIDSIASCATASSGIDIEQSIGRSRDGSARSAERRW